MKGGTSSNYVGADTRPAGPCPKDWPPTVVCSGLKPSSSVGIPKLVSLDSYVFIKSLWACNTNMYVKKLIDTVALLYCSGLVQLTLQTLASSYWRSLMALFLESNTSCKEIKLVSTVLTILIRLQS